MTILGAGRGPSMLGGVTLALDEMQFLLEKLEFDELPVVLQAVGRYDNQADHDAAMQVAENSLVERDLLIDGVVHRELEDRLRTLYRPHWVLALRLVVEGQVSRMCLAPGGAKGLVGPRRAASVGVGEVIDFMDPLQEPVATDRHRLVRIVRVVRGSLPFGFTCRPRFDYAR
uniref:ESX secretion-associated protein EspG n=1 Tax=Nocardia farcinica TaxID=37329 RepID=UPI0024537BB3